MYTVCCMKLHVFHLNFLCRISLWIHLAAAHRRGSAGGCQIFATTYCGYQLHLLSAKIWYECPICLGINQVPTTPDFRSTYNLHTWVIKLSIQWPIWSFTLPFTLTEFFMWDRRMGAVYLLVAVLGCLHGKLCYIRWIVEDQRPSVSMTTTDQWVKSSAKCDV